MPEAKTARYGSWRSPITSDLIVAESVSIADVFLEGDDLYWLEERPREAGRVVLVRRARDASTVDVTPVPFNARTRVHEYGGGAVIVAGGIVYFSNFADQRLYRQPLGGAPAPLTPASASADAGLRYADGRIDGRRNRWVGVREDHRDADREAINTIVAVNLTEGGPGQVLASGYDFYSSLRLSPDGRQMAWLAWNHPNMPWVGTELWLADFAEEGRLANPRIVAGGPRESIFQPEWSPDGRLYFISDRSNWWNLYRLDGDRAEAMYPLDAEFGQPQWVFGMSRYAFSSDDRLICSWSQRGLDKLGILDLNQRTLTPLELPFTDFGALRAAGDRVAFRAGSPNHSTCVVMLDATSGRFQVVRSSDAAGDRPEIARYFSRLQSMEFPTTGGKTAFGLFYPPANPDFTGSPDERPPLVVKCHGGPTSQARSTLDLRTQFWTSRGIAVLDVNYGGSTGFGREYRERLDSNWGIVDVDDCINGAKYLAAQGLADAQRAVITGGSAGGYTVLACLAFRNSFRAGASHYGVSDLAALARDTHKFESRYLDWLIGSFPEQEAVYRQRSPLFSASKIQAPVIFFQGDEDKVVSPNQTELMVDALRANGVPAAYLLFAGEQHGFRQAENIKRAIDAELYFFAAMAFHVGLSF
jgi:dipeptidyl aminopeptidase/acylaminoacyl peptidase